MRAPAQAGEIRQAGPGRISKKNRIGTKTILSAAAIFSQNLGDLIFLKNMVVLLTISARPIA